MTDQGQVSSSAAEVYDELFVPALFGRWAPRIVAATGIDKGMRVVDVACGTGVLAIEAATIVTPAGKVTGIDCNAGMLAVARSKSVEVEWMLGVAERLPFANDTHDAALSQFGLMFFDDPTAALGEMWRILKPGGRLGVAVWDSLDRTPGYDSIVSLLARLFGDAVADRLRAPYSLGDLHTVGALLASAGVQDPRVRRMQGVARFDSIRAWLRADLRGWTLEDEIDDSQYAALEAKAQEELARFVVPSGAVEFDHPAIVATATKS